GMPVPQAGPQPAVGIIGSAPIGATGGLRIEERSGSLNAPYLISCTREKPSFMTVMFDVTTSSPKRPNFFWYCFLTVSRNISSEMLFCLRNGETRENAPRNE